MEPEELTAWRKERGLNQIELAAMLGVTNVCVSRWESGARNIPAFLHLALDCLKVKRKGEVSKTKGKKTKKERRVVK